MGTEKFLYTRRPDDTGWLMVRLADSGQPAYLCEYTQVLPLREADGRVFFKILGGNSAHVGKVASLAKKNASLYLSDVGPGGPAAVQVKYDGAPAEENSPFKGRLKQQWATVTFGGQHAQVTLNSVWDATYTPVPPGAHMIMAPDQSHANISTGGYRSATKGLRCTDVWFPIQLEGKTGNSGRYVHVGHLSEGCVTVHELTKWNALYDYLIACRLGGPDAKYVGNLIVSA